MRALHTHTVHHSINNTINNKRLACRVEQLTKTNHTHDCRGGPNGLEAVNIMRKLISTVSILSSVICLACTLYIKYSPELYMEEWMANYMIFMFSLTSFIFLYHAAKEYKWFRWTKNIRGWNPQFQMCLTTIPTLMYYNEKHDRDGFYYRQHCIIVVLPLIGIIDLNWKYDLVRPTLS